MEAQRGGNQTSLTGSRRFVAGRARQRAVRKAVALLAFLAACCVLSRIRRLTPETNGYATGRRLLSTGSAAAEADDAPGLQEPEVTPPARKTHIHPLFKRAPPHAENSGDNKTLTTKEGEQPKPKPSAGAKGKPKDKDEAETAGKGKQTNSKPGGTEGMQVESGTAEEGGEKGQKKKEEEEATGQKDKQEGGGADDKLPKGETGQDKSEDKPPEESGKKAGEQAGKEQSKKPGTKPKEGNEPKPTKPEDNEAMGKAEAKPKGEPPQTGQKSKTEPDQGSKPKSGKEETGGAKPGPSNEGDSSSEGEKEPNSKSTGEQQKPKEEKPSQGREKPKEGGEGGREEPKPAQGEETGPSRNASKNATKVAEEGEKLKNKSEGEEIDCIRPAYHEFPPDLFSHEARARGGVVVHILVVLYMFYALAVVCDDYFIASLEECCARLNLSEDVAGATFMAAGSSAPELFTAILGVLIAKGDVGTGTIVGSAVFNVLFVIGLCGLCSGKEVPVTWWPLFRDSLFYAFTVVILILVIYDGQVTWYDSLFMLLLYGVYIDIMKYNKRIHQWVATTFGIHEEEQTSLGLTSASYDAKNYSSYVPFNNEIDDYAQQNASRNTRPLDEMIRDSRRRPTLYEAALRMLMTRYFRPKTRFWAAAKRITNEHKRLRRGEIQHLPSQTSLDPNDMVRRGKSSSVDVALSTEADWKKIPSLKDGPWALLKWVVQAPLLATLHYTVPDCRTAAGKRLFLLSFFMSIFWTAAFSYVMVWMVTLIGYTMGIPDTIMGITFLAAGTSIPDAYASLLVSRQGQGDMAIANSIGSNVFDILIGLALPWLIQTGMVEPGSLAYINSGGLVWSVVLLFLTIIITIYTIHRSHWLLTKKLGVFLLVVYVIFLIICSAVEFNLLGYVNPPMCIE
ncbi:sodium/potassium/calcium exchanger 4 [Rhipicephalus sanguineus]|uniref:sodium/potassium/calcium exchanger 4 n=1 Tax=Rhipicephalus sanguineus TaxID=34632 RepID=UPI00189415DC|nr:sodium/potassium/calcium exchanger 4 [Rhipicephalus sanguineus]